MSDEAAVRQLAVPMSVLVVEDEQTFQQLCVEVAESCGMKVSTANTVEEALEVLESRAVDIVLTDLKLQQSN